MLLSQDGTIIHNNNHSIYWLWVYFDLEDIKKFCQLSAMPDFFGREKISLKHILQINWQKGKVNTIGKKYLTTIKFAEMGSFYGY